MSPEDFLKSNKSTNFVDVAFTNNEKKAIHTWMNQYAKHIIKEDEKQRRKK